MKLTVDVKLTPAQIAELFSEMGDEDQAQVFIEVARISDGWPLHGQMQWIEVGHHLRDCKCSTDEARQLLRDIVEGMAPAERAAA